SRLATWGTHAPPCRNLVALGPVCGSSRGDRNRQARIADFARKSAGSTAPAGGRQAPAQCGAVSCGDLQESADGTGRLARSGGKSFRFHLLNCLERRARDYATSDLRSTSSLSDQT